MSPFFLVFKSTYCINYCIDAGFDRLMALVCGAKNIREVIAFPKSYNGRDVLTGSPAQVEPSELREYKLARLKQ